MMHQPDGPPVPRDKRRWIASGHERGAAVVEFAIILPLLIALMCGIVEFGRGYNVKVELTGGVREGARALALGKTPTQAKQAVRDAAPGLNPALTDTNITTTACPAGGADGNATVSVSYNLPSLTPLVFSQNIHLTATGVMRCGS